MRELTYRQALGEALRQEMRRDPDIFLAGEEIGLYRGAFAVTAGLIDEFGPGRVLDTPISEAAIIGLGVGAAAAGLRPVVEIMFIDLIGCCLDQILNQAAKMKYMFGGKARLSLTIRVNTGAGVRAAAQHSQSLEAFVAHIPGLKVVMAATAYDGKGLLISSIRDNNPVVFIEHKNLYATTSPDVPEEPYTIPLGQADVKREGRDVTIVATSYILHEALRAAEQLAQDGIQAEVVDPRTIVPLDVETIVDSVKKTHRAVIVHEAVQFCGVGAEIAATIADQAFDYLDAPVKRVGAPFTPVPISPVLEDAYLPNADKIATAVRQVLGV